MIRNDRRVDYKEFCDLVTKEHPNKESSLKAFDQLWVSQTLSCIVNVDEDIICRAIDIIFKVQTLNNPSVKITETNISFAAIEFF